MRFQGSILAKLVSLSSYEATHMIFSWITSIEQVLVKIEEVTRNRPAGLTNFPPHGPQNFYFYILIKWSFSLFLVLYVIKIWKIDEALTIKQNPSFFSESQRSIGKWE